MTEPTLREIWDTDHSWDNFLACIVIAMPRPLFVLLDRVRHPARAYLDWRKDRWIKTLKVGDEVCSCMGHVTIVAWRSWPPTDEFMGSDGKRHDLFSCCSPIRNDGPCHVSAQEVADERWSN